MDNIIEFYLGNPVRFFWISFICGLLCSIFGYVLLRTSLKASEKALDAAQRGISSVLCLMFVALIGVSSTYALVCARILWRIYNF